MYYEIGSMYEVELPISGSNDIRNEEFLKYLAFQETVLNESTCRRELLIGMVVNHKYRLADQLKKRFRVSTIFSPIFFDEDIPVLIPCTIFHKEEPLIDPAIASGTLYGT